MAGSIKRLGDRKYRVVYEIFPTNGKQRDRRTTTLEGVTKAQAEAYLAERRAELVAERSGVAPKDTGSVNTLIDAWLKSKTTKESTTLKRYRCYTDRYLRPQFGQTKASQLRPSHLTQAYSEWLVQGKSARTVRHIHETFRNVLNFGLRTEVLSRNVATLVSADDLPKVKKPKPNGLTELQMRQLLEEAKNPTKRAKSRGTLSAEPWFFPAVFFSCSMGTRRGETLAVRWADVDPDGKTVTIARSVTETLEFKAPKNDQARTLSMPDSLATVLRTHRAQQNADRLLLGAAYSDYDLVFARADGTVVPPWNFGSSVADCMKRAGIKGTLHDLRDTHASLLAASGVPLEVVSKRLGHSSIVVTAERYLHVYRDRDAAAAAAFEKLVG